MDNLLVSACLLGYECKYCGGSNLMPAETVKALRGKYRLIPVCPESAGGLSTPRDPSERKEGKVVSSKGKDVTAQFEKGADTTCELYKKYSCKAALLKAHSPSCGVGSIYDGSFSGVLTAGDGLSAEKLKKLGAVVYTEKEVNKLI